jgi:hypothetical protein
MADTQTRAYPLIYTFRDDVRGRGFLAEVSVRGRARLVEEDDGWWIYGVEPGGIAEGGSNPHEAYLQFRQAFREVLFDIAEEALGFEEFKRETERVVREVSEPEDADWWKAVQLLRSGALSTEAPLVDSLRREPAENHSEVAVEYLDREKLTPERNILDEPALLAA